MDRVSSKDNPNVKLYQKLSGSKKYRKEYGMFVLEGLRLILDAVHENSELYYVFITKTAEEKYGEALYCLNGYHNSRIIRITDELGMYMSDTGETQGIFAICGVLDKIELIGTIKNSGKYIILSNLQDPGNIGTIIRTADAVGIDAVFLCGCCDIYNPKVIRSTVGSLFRMPLIDNFTAEDIILELKSIGLPVYAAVIDKKAVSLTECSFKNGGAVVIGNEGNGLADAVADLCSNKLMIHMHGNVNSLNAAMAAGIIMWEMLR